MCDDTVEWRSRHSNEQATQYMHDRHACGEAGAQEIGVIPRSERLSSECNATIFGSLQMLRHGTASATTLSEASSTPVFMISRVGRGARLGLSWCGRGRNHVARPRSKVAGCDTSLVAESETHRGRRWSLGVAFPVAAATTAAFPSHPLG